MRVFLLRHGHVEDESDAETSISEKGRSSIIQLANVVSSAELKEVVEIWHNTSSSAEQSCEVFKKSKLDVLGSVKLYDVYELSSSSDVMEMSMLLARCEGDVICCAQNPFLEELVTALCVGEVGIGLVQLDYASMICLERVTEPSEELPIGFWTIRWHIAPSAIHASV